jgi:hypothetical protein
MVALIVIACGDPRPIQHDGKRPQQDSAADEQAATAPAGPGGEMIPGLALPTPFAGADAAPTEASRDTLIADLVRALAEGRAADAVAIADVLIVLDAKDAEAFELRARALDLLSDTEGAGADRSRCCELGRVSCCR